MTHANSSRADADALRIDPVRCALLIVDVQDKLAAAMSGDQRAEVERYVPVLCELAARFDLPVIVTQQYPKGLGTTTAAVAAALEPLGERVHRLDKLEFSVCDAPAFDDIYRQIGRQGDAQRGRDQWIVTGMETHVCVYQSVRGLLARGAQVFVPGDAVASRTADNRKVGLDLIARAGAIPTSTEVVVFDVLRRAGGDDFKALSRLIR